MSIDGGQGWYSCTSNVTNTLFSVSMPTINRITAVGGGGVIVTSTNWGGVWRLLKSNVGVNLYSVCFIDDNTGFAVGEQGVILATTNGGETY
jgi:photosystem II stability/assembly factor-like uncharacterized protein